MSSEKLLTLIEISELLRVSRHTVQAWLSPSSPNYRAEFAILARHAGRKTVFSENEILAWLNQRRGSVYSSSQPERSPYWRERFIAGRGILKSIIKAPEIERTGLNAGFSGGVLALDAEPLLSWLADGTHTADLLVMANRAEGLMLSVPLCSWILRRAGRSMSRSLAIRDFLLGNNIFELAAMNEEALIRSLELPYGTNELSIQGYCSCIAAGASSFLTANTHLLKVPGLRVCGF
jgi:predicted DNA-binding transcriptional regulator AlpA